MKFFSAVGLITLLADRDWPDGATKTIGQHWRRQNAQRRGLTLENRADAKPGARPKGKVQELAVIQHN